MSACSLHFTSGLQSSLIRLFLKLIDIQGPLPSAWITVVSPQACVSQKTRKRLGPENRPVKLPKRLSGVSQSARKKSSPRNMSFSPVNFTGTHYLPKRVFGTIFLYLVNKMASADIPFWAKQTAKALHKKRENWGGEREQCRNEIRILPKRISMVNSS